MSSFLSWFLFYRFHMGGGRTDRDGGIFAIPPSDAKSAFSILSDTLYSTTILGATAPLCCRRSGFDNKSPRLLQKQYRQCFPSRAGSDVSFLAPLSGRKSIDSWLCLYLVWKNNKNNRNQLFVSHTPVCTSLLYVMVHVNLALLYVVIMSTQHCSTCLSWLPGHCCT